MISFKLFSNNLINSIITAGIFVMAGINVNAQDAPLTLSSPDNNLAITFQVLADKNSQQPDGKLVYYATFKGKSLIENSFLSLHLADNETPLGQKVHFAGAKTSSKDEYYNLITGKTSKVRNQFNSLEMILEESGNEGRKLIIEARAYNDALAFRYILPEQSKARSFQLKKESTEFRLSKDAVSYALLLPHFRSMYESEFIKLPLSGFSNQGGVKSSFLIGLPLLLDVPGIAWMAIAEADLRNNATMYLTNPSGSWTGHWLESVLAPQVENPELILTGTFPHKSPWRVLMVASDPGSLIESNVITSLNPESSVLDKSWIKPGKAAWDWWGGSVGRDGQRSFSTETMKYYIDFAAESGLEYMLVDAGWSASNDITKMNGRVDIPELVKYGSAKNVKIWIWVHYRLLDRSMEEALSQYESWGVVGIKTDFIERDDQKGIEFYYRLAESAAKHHIMVDYHGSTVPSGLQRTFPNVLGYEAVLGMEQSKAGARDNPDHHVMLPFTRMLVGLMDYTPGGFNNVTKEGFVPEMNNPMVMGTRAHHLAMYVVYDAPIQMVADRPSAYIGDASFEFIKKVPASWDEVKVLNGLPGEFITLIRRKGDVWYLGSMTNWIPREFDIPLDLAGNSNYRAIIYADAPDSDLYPKKTIISTETVSQI